MMIFLILYVVMSILWSIFCLRVNRVNGRDSVGICVAAFLINVVFAPISLVFGIIRVPLDIKGRDFNWHD